VRRELATGVLGYDVLLHRLEALELHLQEEAMVLLNAPVEHRREPRQMLHSHPAALAVDTPRAVAEVQLHPRHVEVSPLATLGSVMATTGVPAVRAPGLAPGRRNVDHEAIVDQGAVNDAGVFQPEQLVE